MKTMQNSKSPASNGLFKEFYESFWDAINRFSYRKTKNKGELSIS